MLREKISGAEFGRLIGRSRQRVNQLKKAGLLIADKEGVLLIESLRRFGFYEHHADKGRLAVEAFVKKYLPAAD